MTINVGTVAMIPLDSITITNRAREVMGDLTPMEEDMKASGLISPLTVKDNKNGTFLLLAGERRYTVLKKNEITSIPVRIYKRELTQLEMKIIEKSENFHRKDFEFWELDKLTTEIHRMKQELHGVKAPGPDQDGWGTRDTAEMIGAKSPSAVVDSVKRAEAREAFPELFEKCKSASDASKVLKNLNESMIKEVIAKKLENQKTNATFTSVAKCYIVKDFFEGVKDIPDEHFHLVEIDPPYAIDLKKKKKSEGESQYVKDHYNEIDTEHYQVFLSNLFAECYRVMTEHSWLICWFAPEPWFEVIFRELNNAGFSTSRMCGIWTKPSGQTMQPQTRLANSYEMFFYAWKGRPVLNKAGRTNTFNFSPVSPNQKTHPTERPIELTTELYETFAFPGSRVLIPFLGSGNGIISANELGMSPIGFELSKAYRDSFLVKCNSLFNV